MYEAVLFDCFGVIYPDTLGIVERPYVKNKPEIRKSIKQLRILCDEGKLSRKQFWDEAAKLLGVTREELDKKLERVRGADWQLLNYIKNLKKDYKTAIVSNVGEGFIERIFNGIDHQKEYFDTIVVSGEIGVLKPDPRIYLLAAKRLSVKPEKCIFVDDKKRLVEGAEKVGMKGIVFEGLEETKQALEKLLKR